MERTGEGMTWETRDKRCGWRRSPAPRAGEADMARVRPGAFLSFPALAAMVLGVSLTLGAFASLRYIESRNAWSAFEHSAGMRMEAIQRELDNVVASIRMLNQSFKAFAPLSRGQFHILSQPLLERYPFILTLSLQRAVSGEERARFEAGMQKYFPDFTITEFKNGMPVAAGMRERYLVNDYIEPLAGNEALFGFDALSWIAQEDPWRYSGDTGAPAASRPYRMVTQAGSPLCILIRVPVYPQGPVAVNPVTGGDAATGYTVAMVEISGLVASAVASTAGAYGTDHSLSVYARSGPGAAELAYREGAGPAMAPGMGSSLSWLLYDHPASIERQFDVAGAPWLMTAAMAPVFFGAARVASSLTLLGGLLLTLLGTAYAQALNSRSARIQRLVEERTGELHQANQALRRSERAIEASANAIVITSAAGPDYLIEYVNPAFSRMTGYRAEEILGKSLLILSAGEPDQPGLQVIRDARSECREAHAVLRCYRKDGALYWCEVHIAPVRDEEGKVGQFVVMKYDISATKSYEAELEFRANYDVLTGLANRHRLRTRLQLAIAQASRNGYPVWVVSMDLDRFKLINDSLGHRAGDTVLRTVAMRLQSTVRESDTLARLGGDEFVLVLPLETERKPGMAVLQRMLDAIAPPLKIGEQEIFPSCSLGVAVYPANGGDADTLVECADIAMYRAKEAGGNHFQFFNPAMNERVMERLQLEAELRNALERAEFELHYQPQVSLYSGQITGMEALIRWNHPELGRVAPDRFIALAEETGLIIPVGAWVLAAACRQARAWQDAGFDGLRLSVNLSARQFSGQDLVRTVDTTLRETGLEPGRLELELTESVVMTDVGQAINTMRELKALGVKLSIDDFGTGYSSLSYLKQFPIDELKIDRTFVRDITANADDAAVVRAVISMAHSLRLEVVAEGVETLEQLEYLRRHGCDRMQGYVFSRPLPAEDMAALLAQGRRLPGVTACGR